MTESSEFDFFSENVRGYIDFAEKSPYWFRYEQPILKKGLEKISRSSKVLDLGIGTGRVAKLLEVMGFAKSKVYGIDRNQALLVQAKSLVESRNLVYGDILSLAEYFPSNSFGVLTANLVLNSFDLGSLARTYMQAADVLEQGGSITIVLPEPMRQLWQQYGQDALNSNFQEAQLAEGWYDLTPWGSYLPYFFIPTSTHKALLSQAQLDMQEVLYIGESVQSPSIVSSLDLSNNYQFHPENDFQARRVLIRATKA